MRRSWSVVCLAAGIGITAGGTPARAAQAPWVAPPADATKPGERVVDPRVAVAPDGTTTVVWSRSNGTNYAVQAAVRAPGAAGFAAAVELSAPGQQAYGPQVAAAPDGTTTVLWIRYNGTDAIVQTAVRATDAAGFSTPVNLSAPAQDTFESHLAVAPDGAVTSVWTRFDGANRIVQSSVRAPGAAVFSAPEDVSAPGRDAHDPRVAVGPDGAVTVIWRRFNGNYRIVQSAVRPPGAAGFAAPVNLTGADQAAGAPQVAGGPDGTATAVWARSNGSNFIVQSAQRAPGAEGFSTPVDLSAAGRNAYDPQVAVSPDGAINVVWSRFNGTNYIVQSAARVLGTTAFSAPLDLSPAGHDALRPHVGVALDGAATVVWDDFSAGNYVVRSAVRALGAPVFGPPVDLSTPDPYSSDSQMAVAPDGTVAATWTRGNGADLTAMVQATWTANPPTFRAAPKVSGAATSGGLLGCDGGLRTGAASVKITWLRSGTAIGTGPTYALGSQDVGQTIVCRATATNPYGSAEASSAPTLIAATSSASAAGAGTSGVQPTGRQKPRRLTLMVRRRGNGLVLTGALILPTGAPCAGPITTIARTGKRTVTRRTSLYANGAACRYTARLRIPITARSAPTRVIARFVGSASLLPVASTTRTTRPPRPRRTRP